MNTKAKMQMVRKQNEMRQQLARQIANATPLAAQPVITTPGNPMTTDPEDELNRPTAGKHRGMVRGYFRFDLLFPHDGRPPCIEIGFYDANPKVGGTSGEFRISWEDIGDKRGLIPQLQVFEDAWSALASMPDLIIELGEMEIFDQGHQTPLKIQALLERLGFRDMGETKEMLPPKERVELQMLIG